MPRLLPENATIQKARCLEYLKGSRSFCHLPQDVLEQMAELARPKHYAAGDEILQEGVSDSGIFFLCRGRVGVYKRGDLMITLQRSGDIFGETAVIASKPITISAAAESEVEVFKINPNEIQEKTGMAVEDVNNLFNRVFAIILTEKLYLTTETAQRAIAEGQRARKMSAPKNIQEELDQVKKQLEQANKMAMLGEQVAGLAHELNQPILFIRSQAQFHLSNVETSLDKESATQLLSSVELGTDRMITLMDRLKDFSRQADPEFSTVDLNTTAKNSLLLCREQLLMEDLAVETSYADDLPEVVGNSRQLEQVFVNLINNAKDAMKGNANGVLNLKTERRQIEGKEVVAILFQDNGNGMDEMTQQNIFNPFFTTKPEGQGTGLGLSISYGLIESHLGTILVDSKKGRGSVFEVHLPIIE